MVGSSHSVTIGRFEPAKSGDGESEHIQISIIVSMLQVKGTVRRATQDETVSPGLVRCVAKIVEPVILTSRKCLVLMRLLLNKKIAEVEGLCPWWFDGTRFSVQRRTR
jgi:hypothetical protein